MRKKMLGAIITIAVLGTASLGAIWLATGTGSDPARTGAAAVQPATAALDAPRAGPSPGIAAESIVLSPEVVSAALAPRTPPPAPVWTPPQPSSSVRQFRVARSASVRSSSPDNEGLRGRARGSASNRG